MKIKCNDGKVRRFQICKQNYATFRYEEAICLECGKEFGVHDTKILKPMFKEHVCKTDKT